MSCVNSGSNYLFKQFNHLYQEKNINKESDFETQDSTTITLDPTILYQIGASFSTSKTIIGSASNIRGLSSATVLTYTGTGSLFKSVNARFGVSYIFLDAPNGTIFECIGDDTGNVNHRFNVEGVIIFSCKCVLLSDGCGGQVFDLMQVSNFTGTKAFKFIGTVPALIYSFSRISVIGLLAGSAAFDFGTSISRETELSNIITIGHPDAIAISGATNSANITAGNLATVLDCNFTALTNPLFGITQEDIRWDFQGNPGIENSMSDSLLTLTNNALPTELIQNTPIKAVGVWVDQKSVHFVSDTTGRSTYIKETGERLPIDISFGIKPSSGNNVLVTVYIAINSSIVNESKVQVNAGAIRPEAGIAIWQHDFQLNDYVEVFVENNGSSTDLILVNSVMRNN